MKWYLEENEGQFENQLWEHYAGGEILRVSAINLLSL